MTDRPSKRLEWVAQDSRDWALISTEEDHLTARLICTYFEAEHIECRITARAGRFWVEVPLEYYDAAARVYGNEALVQEDAPAPVLQEVSQPTSVKTVRRIKEALAARGVDVQPDVPQSTTKRTRVGVALVLLALAIAALLIWIWRQG